MFFRGEVRRGQEGEAKPNIIVQFAYYPVDMDSRLAAIPGVEKAAFEFFSEDPGVTNVFLTEAPSMPGLNIPHFREWQQKTGKFLEGYLQHTRTGFMRSKPYNPKELVEVRSNLEQIFALPASEMSRIPDNEKSELYFFGSLLMLDRLAKHRRFTLEVKPESAKDFLRSYKESGRLLRQVDKDISDDALNALLTPPVDMEKVLAHVAREAEKLYRGTGELERRDTDSFHAFLSGVLDKYKRQPTRIFIPRKSINQKIDLIFQANNKGRLVVSDLDKNIQGLDNELSVEVLSRFMSDPQSKITRNEALQFLANTLIEHGMGNIGMDEMVEADFPKFISSISEKELEQLVLDVLNDVDGDEGITRLLNVFGKNTTGSTYGTARKFSAIFKDVLSGDEKARQEIKNLLGDKLRAAMEEFEEHQKGD